jgi:hypothetical protein
MKKKDFVALTASPWNDGNAWAYTSVSRAWSRVLPSVPMEFLRNPADFKITTAFSNTNDGAGGIPYFAGTSNATCLAKAQAIGPLAIASLTN